MARAVARWTHRAFPIALVTCLVALAPHGQAADRSDPPPRTAATAGRTSAQWTDQLDHGEPALRLQAIAVLAQTQPAATAVLVRSGGDADPSVRYWSARGLALVTNADRKNAISTLETMLKDDTPSVRIAAAVSLCQLDRPPNAVPVLISYLSDDDETLRLAAAVALDQIGEHARPAIKAMTRALKDKNKYVVRNVNRTLNFLQHTQNEVP